eukprot:SAG11_NODE_765_length_7275_cov_16.594203_6_plen_74_part_00
MQPHEQDSDANHPFLLLWPETYLLVCSLVDPATRRNGEREREHEVGEVSPEIIYQDEKWANTEERLDSCHVGV